MPVLFVHGVNNRASDCDYFQECGLRKEMLERLVVAPLRGRFPSFAVSEDAYWGDLGVRYRWGLRSVPPTRVLESLGTLGPGQPPAAELEANPDLLVLLAELPPAPPGPAAEALATLGPGDNPGPLVAAARQDPAGMIRAIAAPEREGPEPGVPGGEPELDAARRAKCEEEGRQRARVILAADEAARSEDVLRRLRAAPTDEAVLAVVQEETLRRYEELVGEQAGVAGPRGEGLELLGVRDVAAAGREWVAGLVRAGRGRIAGLVTGARNLAQRVGRGTARGASLAVLRARRERITRHAAIFFGDVFEYLRRGQTAGDQLGTIGRRVADHLLAAAKVAREQKEPLALVTHSFGSAITYDLLTSALAASSAELEDLHVDLWVMAGSQAAVFAEMRAYLSSPGDVPSAGRPTLGRPGRVNTLAQLLRRGGRVQLPGRAGLRRGRGDRRRGPGGGQRQDRPLRLLRHPVLLPAHRRGTACPAVRATGAPIRQSHVDEVAGSGDRGCPEECP